MKTPLLRGALKFLVIMMCTGPFEAFHIPEPAWSADLMSYIKENYEHYRQVMIITCKDSGVPFENYWIRKILHTAMATFPTIRINVDFSSNINEEWSFHRTDATATLFIFVDDSDTWRHHQPKDVGKVVPQQIISIMKDLSLNKKIAKYLALFLSSEQTLNFDDLLRHAWEMQMIDLTIIEVIGCQSVKTTILNDCVDDSSLPVIHHFNPFLDSIIRKTYEPGMKLFPDIMKNMHGYPLKIGIRHHPPFSSVSWDNNSNYESMSGLDIQLIHTMAESMNFTLQILPQLMTFEEMQDNSSNGLFNFLRSDKIDIFASPHPHYTEDMEEHSFRSEAFIRDQLCAMVPLRKTVRILLPKTVTETLILTIGIVLIFWASIWLFRFSQSWSIFTIVRVLFGIPVFAHHARLKPAQRVIIQILMIISLLYSAKIYASLTNINIDVVGAVEIETLDDLDQSGLIPKIHPHLMDKTFGHVNKNDQTLMNLKRKTVSMRSMMKCLSEAEKFKNTTCLMTTVEGYWFIRSTYRHREPALKMTQACFWSDSYAFLFREGSPYRNKIDNTFRLLAEGGIPIIWARNDTSGNFEEQRKDNNVFHELQVPPPGVLRDQLTVVLLFGLTIAIITFIGELLWYHRIKRWKSV
ncbi:uncharacterized protein LOC114841186 [Diachasma alloeum]|uniref:Ionotropic receptor 124 n=1 Tax=Diachasma alloeum TaxID=454923 RepID=A0A4E0RLJ6_9HYME|nr:uncharacterized protein LOC114841186 [Diachasma alloeum]THK33009.1 ionotropic receptor 124 [Diachasma alloeum]